MNRIVRNVAEVGAVKSKEVILEPDRSTANSNGACHVDLQRSVKGNGKVDIGPIGCPETNGLVFPIDCLQGPMRMITEEVSRQERNPNGLAAACVLGTVSAAIGKGLKIHSHVNKTCPANVYILVSTSSGQGKSETLRPIIKPLRNYEIKIIDNWERNIKPHLEAQERRFKSEIKRLGRQLANPKFTGDTQAIDQQLTKDFQLLNAVSKQLLAPPCLVVENATSEATAKLLAANAECLASVSSDARELINILCGRYTDGKTDESVFIKAFSCEPRSDGRITREPVVLREPCLTCLWLVQPDKLAEVFSRSSLTIGGLLPRFMILLADYKAQPIDRTIPGLSPGTEALWDELIRHVLETYRFAKEPSLLAPTQDAIDLLDNHYNAIIVKRNTTLQRINSFAARWNEQAWRLMVVLHAGKYGNQAHNNQVDTETAKAAITLADWFAEHQLWVLQTSELAGFATLSRQVIALCRKQGDRITATDLYRGHIVADAEAAHALLKKMEQAGKLFCEERPTRGGGHTMKIYTTTPPALNRECQSNELHELHESPIP